MISRNKSNFFRDLSITGWLIGINAIFFLVVILSSLYYSSIISFVALSPNTFFNNYYFWTLITSMFMHGGFIHLFVNMLSLMFIGGFIEKIVGRKRFSWFYLGSGVFSGLLFVFVSLLFNDSALLGTGFLTSAVGASGAIFGIAGLMVVLTPNLPVYAMFIPIPIKAKFAVPGLLVLIAVISATGGFPVGNIAHLGGFLAGLGYGFFLKNKFRRKVAAISNFYR
ncbi:hypothetical protein COU61_04510 [Candidatus Pacearchaeota archaeon CG10_big_fil_rev_8_21_14_0_10_35_13]|nr:MAG: hypothetical protein COU61_04510 [Candidatus Pacearchaeota archaeon CG10_big_fil_rev_8_21_14_0_10_35_13]